MVEESVIKEYDETDRDFPGAYLGSGDDGAGGGENVGCVTVELLTSGSAPALTTCAGRPRRWQVRSGHRSCAQIEPRQQPRRSRCLENGVDASVLHDALA